MDDITSTMSDGELDASPQLSVWGPFRLVERVGQGAFGEVYRAFDTTLQREVAVKLLRPRGLDSEQESREILHEARLLAKVRHPNIVSVYGVDRRQGRVGFWSDFVRGRTLAALLRTQGPFGPHEAALIGVDLAQAVSAVHAAGLLHRDIKSSNAMREEGGRILLMDFGIAHALGDGQHSGGTPAFMAPELLAGEAASTASDIYALGVVLFELLTAKLPYPGATLAEARRAHESGARRHLLDLRPELPQRLARVVEKAIDRDPARRYSSAGQLIAALTDATALSSAPAAARRRRLRPWMLAPAAALLAGALWLTPLGEVALATARRATFSTAGAYSTYLNAQDLLDHYYRPGATREAIRLCEQIIAADPGFALAYAGLARARFLEFWHQRDPKSAAPAIAAAATALELDPNLAGAHVTLCRLYTETGRNDMASREAAEALRLDAHNAEAFAALAELHYRQGRVAEVAPTLQKAIDLAPTDWRFPDQFGYFLLRTGRIEQAAAQFRLAVRLSPDNPRALNNLALACQRLDRLSEAREALEQAIRIEPGFNRFNLLGVIFEREGKYEEAAKAYRKALDYNAGSYVAWGNLAYVYRLLGRESLAVDAYTKAIAASQELRRTRPSDPILLAALGSFHAALGQADEAIPLLRQAAALAPEDPIVLYLGAQGNEVLHRREEALRLIARAMDAGLARGELLGDARLAQLRADPRFPELAAQHHNPAYKEK
jgi:Flp pilus assembly protein TadD/tRNA A-37 threonylcarbamoyl transferase component Bud32